MSQLLPLFHHTLNPTAVVNDVPGLIRFMEGVFGAEVLDKIEGRGGVIVHAEIRVGDAVLYTGSAMGGDEHPALVSIYVDDVDDTFKRAVQAGATGLQEPRDVFYGHRTARVKGPTGNTWSISTIREVLSSQEILARMANLSS